MNKIKIALKIKNLTKHYPGVKALEKMSLEIKEGEIHAVVGENGAGKSTFIKLLSGAITPNKGTMEIFGQEFSEMSPFLSNRLGIEVIYQELTLIPNLSVADNICIGNYPGNKIILNFKEMEQRTYEVFEKMKVDINPKKSLKDLTVAHMQLVEIAKALTRDVKILIMDEPTSSLSLNEVDTLMEIVKNLKANGKTIIYISHKLDEVFKIADRITVFRDGMKMGTFKSKEINRRELINKMVGREFDETFPNKYVKVGDVVFEAKNLKSPKVNNISFSVKKGEIIGIAGLVGAGRTELVRLIFGADRMDSGELFLEGKKVTINNPSEAMSNGIGLVPEDRKQHGIILSLSIRDNITLPILKNISRVTVINKKRENEILNKYKDALKIKAPNFEQKVEKLSGGNQQKVVLSKWLASQCKVLILDEPTRGIDVGAKKEIYFLMKNLAAKGIAIIMVSSEMEEIIGISDRVIVLHEGNMMGILEKREFTQKRIMELASGIYKKGFLK